MRLAYQVVSGASPVEVVSARHYVEVMDQEMGSHPRAGFLTFHNVSEIQSEGMIPLLANHDKTGTLIWDHHNGDIESASLFSTSDVPGAGLAMLQYAIDTYGVNYVEAFQPLVGLYERLGFKSFDSVKFDPQYASPKWNYLAHGTPDVHYLRR